MDQSTIAVYKSVLKDYPDVMNSHQVCEVLRISKKTLYKLIREGDLDCLKIGREYKIPKVTLMKLINIIHEPDDI